MDTKNLSTGAPRATHVYTVSELTQDIKLTLEGTFHQKIWVHGEISNFKIYGSGNAYFSLKDEKSIIRVVVFGDVKAAIPFACEDGMEVLCYGRLGVYAKQGSYQLYLESMQPKGVGALQLAFDQLKKKLEKQGFFDEKRKRPLPLLPKKIGIITSPSGAALRDILQIINRRFSDIEIVIRPARVQGTGAAEDIAQGIRDLNTLRDIEVLIVGRGGGSLEDLWAFNEEEVAHAIYQSRIPIISAVGHETDFTIADMVADVRAPTPSAAAELVIGKKQELLDTITHLSRRAQNNIELRLGRYAHELTVLTSRRGLAMIPDIVRDYTQRVDEMLKTQGTRLAQQCETETQVVRALSEKLVALNPLAVLARGYSVTQGARRARVLVDAAQVKEGDHITTILARGVIVSKVEETQKSFQPSAVSTQHKVTKDLTAKKST